jgi:hypothetical protein
VAIKCSCIVEKYINRWQHALEVFEQFFGRPYLGHFFGLVGVSGVSVAIWGKGIKGKIRLIATI